MDKVSISGRRVFRFDQQNQTNCIWVPIVSSLFVMKHAFGTRSGVSHCGSIILLQAPKYSIDESSSYSDLEIIIISY